MIILGQNNVFRHGPLTVYAENGFVRLRDSRDGSLTTISVKDCALRAQAISDMIKNSASTDEFFDYAQVIELQRVLDGYIDVMRKAQEQGQHDDPTAVRDRRRRAPVSISVSGLTNDLGM